MSFKVTNPFALIAPTIRHFAYLAISVASLLYKGILADILNFIVMLFSCVDVKNAFVSFAKIYSLWCFHNFIPPLVSSSLIEVKQECLYLFL